MKQLEHCLNLSQQSLLSPSGYLLMHLRMMYVHYTYGLSGCQNVSLWRTCRARDYLWFSCSNMAFRYKPLIVYVSFCLSVVCPWIRSISFLGLDFVSVCSLLFDFSVSSAHCTIFFAAGPVIHFSKSLWIVSVSLSLSLSLSLYLSLSMYLSLSFCISVSLSLSLSLSTYLYI